MQTNMTKAKELNWTPKALASVVEIGLHDCTATFN